jgi:hypothetical protein
MTPIHYVLKEQTITSFLKLIGYYLLEVLEIVMVENKMRF